MFEKEAEEKYCKGCKLRIEQCLWAWRNTKGLNEPNEKNCSCIKVPAYIAGAEFGYNKANEWHYVKDGDYPKDTKTVLALCIVGGEPYPYLAQYWKGSTTAKKNGVDLNWNCWLNNMQREVVEPYAWKEIVLPKESE